MPQPDRSDLARQLAALTEPAPLRTAPLLDMRAWQIFLTPDPESGDQVCIGVAIEYQGHITPRLIEAADLRILTWNMTEARIRRLSMIVDTLRETLANDQAGNPFPGRVTFTTPRLYRAESPDQAADELFQVARTILKEPPPAVQHADIAEFYNSAALAALHAALEREWPAVSSRLDGIDRPEACDTLNLVVNTPDRMVVASAGQTDQDLVSETKRAATWLLKYRRHGQRAALYIVAKGKLPAELQAEIALWRPRGMVVMHCKTTKQATSSIMAFALT